MSITHIVFLNSKLFPENSRIEEKVHEMGYEFKFLEKFTLTENDVTCSIDGHNTYIESFNQEVNNVLKEYPWIKPDIDNEDIAVSFIFSSDMAEIVCISLISLALISLINAKVYYIDDKMRYTYDMLLKEILQGLAKVEKEEKIQIQEKPKARNVLLSFKKLFISSFKQNNKAAKINKKSDWENLKVYHNLDKKDIIPVFKKFGQAIYNNITGYSFILVNTMIKFSRIINNLEQAIFIERGADKLKVKVCIKPVDLYDNYEFTMINQVSLGKILNNHRRTSFPLTQEWELLSQYLSDIISNEIEMYFEKFSSYEKIILQRAEIEHSYQVDTDNVYQLLIYAAIHTQNRLLLIDYIDKKLLSPIVSISNTEYDNRTISDDFNVKGFLEKIKSLAVDNNFEQIRNEISNINNK